MIRILCGVPISEDKEVFEAHIKSLLEQGYEMDYKGIDNSPEPLKKPIGFNSIEWHRDMTMGEYKQNRVRWGYLRMRKVGEYREEIRLTALKGNYDYLFTVDSDLILGKDTLKLLLEANKDFIAGLFWTKFRPWRRHYWANVWEMENGKHIPPNEELLRKLHSGGIHQVPMTGACSLISKRALNMVSYAPVNKVYGEDICLAIRAREVGLPLFVHAGVKIEHRRRR